MIKSLLKQEKKILFYPLTVTVIFWNWYLWITIISMLKIPESEVNAINTLGKSASVSNRCINAELSEILDLL